MALTSEKKAMGKRVFHFIGILLALLMFGFAISACNRQKDSLDVIELEPQTPVSLKVGQLLKIHCKYVLSASSKGVVYANFFYKGKKIRIYVDSGQSALIETPVGTITLEVFFKEPVQIDEMKLSMDKADTWSVIKRAADSWFDTNILTISVMTDIRVIE